MKIAYQTANFRAATLDTIETVNQIIEEYQAQEFTLTLRQLYYQMVARDLIENSKREYKKLSVVVSNGRLAGLIDWSAIEDRTRYRRAVSHWEDGPDILDTVAEQFRVDKWERQYYAPRVWIEKDALTGVIADVCRRFDVPYMACIGYLSQSAIWKDTQRMLQEHENVQVPIVIHLGDHDPSGIDMTRDIEARLETFGVPEFRVERIALNYDQVQTYNPPPNFAKMTDSRIGGYLEQYGNRSWELDALEPSVIAQLVESKIAEYLDLTIWNEDVDRENDIRKILAQMAGNYDGIREFLNNGNGN